MKLCAEWSQNSDVSIKTPFPPNRVKGADKPRGASNDMPNRFLFGVAFDRPGSRGKDFCFQNKQSPSLEREWPGRLRSCDLDGCLATEGAFGKASAFYLPSLFPARPGYEASFCFREKAGGRGKLNIDIILHYSRLLLWYDTQRQALFRLCAGIRLRFK